MNQRKVAITGITGQIGSYLAEDILENTNDIVYGLIRRSSSINTKRIDSLYKKYNGTRLFLIYGDMTDPLSIEEFVKKSDPDLFFNLAAQSHVKVSFEIPVYTANCDALGELYVLESLHKHKPNCKLYQASTSELFGGQLIEMPPNGFSETTPFHPRSPYGVAKLYAYWITKNYRESYGFHACNGILFNTESSRRGDTFVTKKITNYVFDNLIKCFNDDSETITPLQLGNLNAVRDWNHAKDSVKAIRMVLEQPKAEDWVIGSGITTSVKKFIELAVNIQYKKLFVVNKNIIVEWRGEGLNETGWINNKLFVETNKKYYRPAEVDFLKANPEKIKSIGWVPEYNINQTIEEMLSTID